MTRTVPTALPVVADRDGMAVIGRTRHDLMGLRYGEGDGGNAAAAEQTAATGGEQTAQTGTETGQATAGAASTGTEAQDVGSLPAWAQKVITDTRAEAARYRTGQQTAAQTAQQELADKIAQAIGLKPDAAADPAALTASLTEAQTAKKQVDIQLAVYKAAGAAGANPDALLDSRTFLAEVSDLDPTASDFSDKVGSAITAAVAANASLKAARAAGASTVNPEAGSPEGQPITEAQLAQMTPKQISDAFDKGLLKHLL